MKRVFLLQHVYVDAAGHDEVKVIGIFSSRGSADRAARLLTAQPGFAAHPDGFQIDEYDVDKAEWREGFMTVEEAIADIPNTDPVAPKDEA